jgi:hypothetical protein
MNAFTQPAKPPAWLAKLNRDHKNKTGGGAAAARAAGGVAVPSMTNGRGVKQLAARKG